MSRTVLAICCVCIMVGTLPSCKLKKVMKRPVKKHAVDTTALKSQLDSNKTADTFAVGSKQQLINALTPIWNRTVDFKTFTAKAKMHYDGPELNVDFTAHIRIRKDSVIWINIVGSFLGIQAQAGRVLITRDSVKFVNQLQKEVTLMAMNQATSLLNVPVDYATLQNVILGDAFRKSGILTDVTALPEAWAIQVEDDSSIQRITYNKADSTMANVQVAMRNNNSLHGTNQFRNYTQANGRKFSITREATIQYSGKQYYLGMDFQNFDFDQEQDYPFSIPHNYSIAH